jgi:small-conductance mechanosensitive channel
MSGMQDIIQRTQSAEFIRKLLRASIIVGVIVFAMALVTWRNNTTVLVG